MEITAELGSERLTFSVYEARPKGKPLGSVVVVQEIFGVNSHIRSIADSFAERGWLAWAPSFFDPEERGVELDYSLRSVVKGRDLMTKLGWERALAILETTAHRMREENPNDPLAVVGYCWGGSLAWLSATRFDLGLIDGAITYYGRHVIENDEFKIETNRVPMIMHFGASDPSIPLQGVEEFKGLHPEIQIYVYDAGHGFNCNQREDYNAEAADLALKRTMGFLNDLR